MNPITVRASCPDGFEPVYASPGAAGADLRAYVANDVTIPAGERVAVPTGIRLDIPAGYEGQVRPRSGLARNHGITILNAPGTIDSDYRGEVQVVLVNLGTEPFTVRRGDRIAQLVICPVTRASFIRGSLSETERGEGGFGSTGSG